MPKFRKKPVEVEAVQWDGTDSHEAVSRYLDTAEGVESWRADMAEAWGNFASEFYGIHTLEGVMRLSPGDWIIRGVRGEFYPCKPDIFAATYEDAAIALMRGQSWRSLLDSPEKSGRYVVCHRGGIAGHAFYVHPSDSPIGNLTAGWNQMPDFRPTHWTAPVDIGLRESNQLRRALDPAPPKDTADEQ